MKKEELLQKNNYLTKMSNFIQEAVRSGTIEDVKKLLYAVGLLYHYKEKHLSEGCSRMFFLKKVNNDIIYQKKYLTKTNYMRW